MYSREKEFLKLAFMKGWLDLGNGYDVMKAFCEIMAGEAEALIAIQFCRWLDEDQREALLDIAAPTEQTFVEWASWNRSVDGPITETPTQ